MHIPTQSAPHTPTYVWKCLRRREPHTWLHILSNLWWLLCVSIYPFDWDRSLSGRAPHYQRLKPGSPAPADWPGALDSRPEQRRIRTLDHERFSVGFHERGSEAASQVSVEWGLCEGFAWGICLLLLFMNRIMAGDTAWILRKTYVWLIQQDRCVYAIYMCIGIYVFMCVWVCTCPWE